MTSDILEVVWVGLLAGVGITTAYSFVVLGTGEARRAEGAAAVGWAVLAVIALLVFAGGVIYGVHIMLSK
jgi:hypothetical protein